MYNGYLTGKTILIFEITLNTYRHAFLILTFYIVNGMNINVFNVNNKFHILIIYFEHLFECLIDNKLIKWAYHHTCRLKRISVSMPCIPANFVKNIATMSRA